MSIQPTQWTEGYVAGINGDWRCPYLPMTAERLAWQSGWIEGRRSEQQVRCERVR